MTVTFFTHGSAAFIVFLLAICALFQTCCETDENQVIYWRDAVQWDVKTVDKHPDDERGSTGLKYKNLVL